MAKYGPQEEDLQKSGSPPTGILGDDFSEGQEEWEREDEIRVQKQGLEFHQLLQDVINATSPLQLPSIMSKRIDILLQMRGYEVMNAMNQTIQEAESAQDEQRLEDVMAACDYIVSFTEEFVEQARQMDDQNKMLLGKILQTMTKTSSSQENPLQEKRTDREREKALEQLLQDEKENFTPGFLRHVEGECNRIQTAPRMSPDSAKLLQTLRMIQTRVVEELGKELGEGAQILGQLLGYDDRNERIAVLEAGLTVRGIDFAREMASLTEEALDGFKAIDKQYVDPELEERVQGLHTHIINFISTRSSWE